MYDVSTSIGRLLSELKFCAVMIVTKTKEKFIATRCCSIIDCSKFPNDGINGNKIIVKVIDKSENFDSVKILEEREIDFNDIESYRMTQISSKVYLDSTTMYD